MSRRVEFKIIIGMEGQKTTRASVHFDDIARIQESVENPYKSLVLMNNGILMEIDEDYDSLIARLDEFYE